MISPFMFEEIRKNSLAEKIAQIKIFDKGSTWYIEREGKSTIILEPIKYVAKSYLDHDSVIYSDFDMIRAFFITLAKNMIEQQDSALIQELEKEAGLHIDAKGDILGGLIEAAKQLRSHNGHNEDLLLIINPQQSLKLYEALKKDPDRAKILRELISKRK